MQVIRKDISSEEQKLQELKKIDSLDIERITKATAGKPDETTDSFDEGAGWYCITGVFCPTA